MPASDLKITALTAIGANPINVATFPIPMVDLLDNSMAASGTTKKVTVNQILGAGGTATLASATISGDLTVDTNTLKVDSANNRVGIGTATPSSDLHIRRSGGGSTLEMLRLDNAGAGVNSAVQMTFWAAGTNYGNITGGFGGATPILEYNVGSTGYHGWQIAGSEQMRLNSTGLGVGVSPATKLHVSDNTGSPAFRMNGAATANNGPFIEFYKNNVRKMLMGNESLLIGGGSTSDNFGFYNEGAFDFKWYINGTVPKMTLDASGNLFVRCATAGAEQLGFQVIGYTNGNYVRINHNASATSGDSYLNFLYNATPIGSISQNGTTGVLYNINSDYRLKESVQPLVGGLARVNALKPSVYKWKSDGSTGEGFLAHELAEVVPFAVTGEKDAVNEDGSIKSQGIDMSRVVPILVAAIQELTARVQTLETR